MFSFNRRNNEPRGQEEEKMEERQATVSKRGAFAPDDNVDKPRGLYRKQLTSVGAIPL